MTCGKILTVENHASIHAIVAIDVGHFQGAAPMVTTLSLGMLILESKPNRMRS